MSDAIALVIQNPEVAPGRIGGTLAIARLGRRGEADGRIRQSKHSGSDNESVAAASKGSCMVRSVPDYPSLTTDFTRFIKAQHLCSPSRQIELLK
jgi:hypothetical protein